MISDLKPAAMNKPGAT